MKVSYKKMLYSRLLFLGGAAVPMGISAYICRESALIIGILKCSATSIATFVLPIPVGPIITMRVFI